MRLLVFTLRDDEAMDFLTAQREPANRVRRISRARAVRLSAPPLRGAAEGDTAEALEVLLPWNVKPALRTAARLST